MSRIIFVNRPPTEDLREWLERNALTIVVQPTSYGWQAAFKEPVGMEGDARARPSGSDAKQEALLFIRHLQGQRISCHFKTGLVIPEFTGIEEALAEATQGDP